MLMLAKMAMPALGDVYDADAAAAFAAMTTQPDATRKGLLNDLIVGLKTDGVWSSLDWLCALAAHDAQAARLNLKNPAKSLTAVSSPTFTTDRGYAGNGSSSYLDMGEPFAKSGNNFSQNSCHFGVWCNTAGGAGGQSPIGDGSSTYYNYMWVNGTATYFKCSDSTETTATIGTNQLGSRTASRTSSTSKKLYFYGSAYSTTSTASVAPWTSTINGRICAGGGYFSSGRVAAAYSGGGLSDSQVQSLHNRLNTFLTAIGAN